jgi:hypothetical protein
VSRRAPALLQLLVLAAAAGMSASTILRGVGPHDEGLMLAWAERIASGQWPYRDFWCNYAPGQPLVLAGLVKLFGPSLLAWRVLRTVVDAVTALLAYRLVRRDAPEPLALAAALAVAGAMTFPTGPGPTPPALLLAFAALLSARRSPAAAGVLAGLAFLFRFEVGIAAALGVALETGLGAALWALLTGAAGLAPFLAVAPRALVGQTVGFARVEHLQRLPFPLRPHGADPNKLLELWFPLLLLIGTGVWLVWALARRPDRRAVALAPLLAIGVAYLLSRTDEFHLVPLSAALAVAVAIAAGGERALPARVALVVVLAVVVANGLDRKGGQWLHPPALAAVPGPVGDGVETDPADARALARLLPAIRRLVPPGGPLFVAPPRFDRVRVGDPLLNVIAQRPNPTRYDVMQPGIVTTAAAQRSMERALERTRTRVVVRWLAPAATRLEPNGSARSSGVHLLDRYIAAHYAPRARFGDYLLLVRISRRSGSGSAR